MARDVDVPAGMTHSDPVEDLSLGDLVGRITGDITQLFRQEIELAKTEIKQEAARAGKGAGLMSGAAVAGLLALQLSSLALAWAVDTALWRWVAFFIIAAMWTIVAVVLFNAGKRQLTTLKPPQQTVETLKEDAQWAKDQMR